MNRLFAAGMAMAVLALPAVSAAQSHHGGGSHGGGYSGGSRGGDSSSSSTSGSGGYRGQGSAVRESGGGYRSGGYRGGSGYRGFGYRGGYGRGYGYGGYRGYGFYPYFGFGFEAAFFDPWYGGYPFYYGAPWYYDYVDGAPYPPPGVVNDPYGVPGSWVRDRYPDRPDSAWDRDYGPSSDDPSRARPSAGGSGAACGQWVWNEGAGKYDWQAAVCAPSTPGRQAGVDAPPLKVPPVS